MSPGEPADAGLPAGWCGVRTPATGPRVAGAAAGEPRPRPCGRRRSRSGRCWCATSPTVPARSRASWRRRPTARTTRPATACVARPARNRCSGSPAPHTSTAPTACTGASTSPWRGGVGAAVLVRAARVVTGHAAVRRRRPDGVRDRDLLRGPGGSPPASTSTRLATTVATCSPGSPASSLRPTGGDPATRLDRRRTAGRASRRAADRPWRFHLRDAPEVSATVARLGPIAVPRTSRPSVSRGAPRHVRDSRTSGPPGTVRISGEHAASGRARRHGGPPPLRRPPASTEAPVTTLLRTHRPDPIPGSPPPGPHGDRPASGPVLLMTTSLPAPRRAQDSRLTSPRKRGIFSLPLGGHTVLHGPPDLLRTPAPRLASPSLRW
jgi:hypothetical protein